MKDDILVKQALNGDHQAFHILITRYYTAIHNMIFSWVRDPEDAKDLTQDVFISAYQNLPSLKRPESFYAWLQQIARRRCQNWQRNKQGNIITLQDDLVSKETPVDEVLILRETLAKVMSAIDNLSESEKNLLKERYLDDTSYDELSARHGVSTKALVVRLVRTRRKIKEYLGKTLSAFVAFFHKHSESILTGGVEIMKLSVKTKLIAGGIVAIFILGGAGVLIRNQYMQDEPKQVIPETPQESYPKTPAKSISDVEKLSINGAGNLDQKEINREKTQIKEFKSEIVSMNESNIDKPVNDNDSKATGVSSNESKEITPDIKQKIEIYTQLSSILPEYKRLWPHLLNMPAGDKNRTDEQLALVKRSYELDMKIVEMCESFLKPPAIVKDEKGVVQQMNLAPMFAQMAEHLGKELPFDGNTDYFTAKDYQGGTGGW